MAKSFRFPLQKVLHLRKMIEESRALALKGSQAVLEEERIKLTNLKNRKESLMDFEERDGVLRASFSLNDLQISMDYITQLNKMISSQTNRVRKSNEVVNNNRTNLVKASKNKKIVEKLRERQLTNYIKDYRKREIKKEDEIASRIGSKSKTTGVGR